MSFPNRRYVSSASGALGTTRARFQEAAGRSIILPCLANLRILLVVALGVQVAACSQTNPPGSRGEAHGVLSLGLLPDENSSRQRQKYAPLVESITRRTGFDVRLVSPSTYAELVALFAEGEVDIAYFGGYTFSIAHELHGAVPLVMRDIDASFVSFVVVREDNDAQQLSDLVGARFSFGSRSSTSGHVMPRYFFRELGIEPESFFSDVTYSGAHDRTIGAVIDGTVDAGVVNGQLLEHWLNDGENDPPTVRILWQSPDYPNYVWAVQPSMTNTTRRSIKAAFLALATDDAAQSRFLDDVGAKYFVPAAVSDFDRLSAAIRDVGAMPEDQ